MEVDRRRAREVAAVARAQAEAAGVALPDDLRLFALAGPTGAPLPDAEHKELAQALEAATPSSDRRTNGLHVTPKWLADHLVDLALDGLPADDLTVCDPACGGGAFLLAAARALHARGFPRSTIVGQLLWGADVDPVGLAAAEAALALWAGEPPPPGRLVLGDVLLGGAAVWPEPPAGGFAAVVGNPPFLNQLERATVRSRDNDERLRQRFGAAVQPYTDAAWLFLLLGVELARTGGQVALLQPYSLVSARDAGGIRAVLDERAAVRDLWVERGRSFAASVQVCAPILQVGEPSAEPRSWADRLADALGVPPIDTIGTQRLGDRARVLAGFRDEYYGLVPMVREAEPGEDPRPLVTAGVLDWGRSAWGERRSRFAKRWWIAPVVDLDRRDPDDDSAAARGGQRWIERVTGPKVVVASQTRVVEAAVDVSGRWIPSVPALAVIPEQVADLWPLAAAVAAPSSTAWLLRRAPGTALSRGALKIAAGDLADLPLPVEAVAWNRAAAALRDYAAAPSVANRDVYVAAAAAAYRSPAALVDWWWGRFPSDN
jgi:hypothetical protein